MAAEYFSLLKSSIARVKSELFVNGTCEPARAIKTNSKAAIKMNLFLFITYLFWLCSD